MIESLEANQAAGAIRTRMVEHSGSSASAGTIEPQSFRSRWQQMVAALGDTAEETDSATVETGRSQTVATKYSIVSSPLNGNLSRVEIASQSFAEAGQSEKNRPAQASATFLNARVISEPAAAPETKEELASVISSAAPRSWRAKQSVGDRPATAKSTQMQTGSLLSNDAATAIAAQFFQPVQPATMTKTPASNPSQPPTVNISSGNQGEHPATASANPGSQVSVSNVVIPDPETQPYPESSVDPSPETPISAAGEGPPSHMVIANQSPKVTVESPESATAGQLSSQMDTASKGIAGAVQIEPSTNLAAEPAAVSSRSTVIDAEIVRPRIAAARTGNGFENVRVDRSTDAQLDAAAAEGIHGQLNGAAGSAVVVRDAGSALPSNTGPGVVVQTASGTSPADTFSALDGASGSMQPTWIHAGPHQAEAGFDDPALGWVSVRAGVNASGISAVVVPGSADAAQALGARMAGLHDYLAEQHSPVETLTLGSSLSSGTDGGSHQGMQNQGHQSAQDNAANAQALSSIQPSAPATAPAQTTHMNGDESPAIQFGSGGRYISVMA
jgi:hypothetical protein